MPPSPDPAPRTTQEQVVLGGRYALGPLLGRGGAADVHRATDVLLDRDVAVKVLRDTAAADDERARFITEARTLARLAHPGLVTLLDAGLEGEKPYLVMELIEGRTLRDFCNGPPGAPGWVAGIGAQVAQALSAVHHRGIVHRDVKPANVLVDHESRRAWLTDFGIARLLQDPAGHTHTGMAVGTAAYLAPEQVTGSEVTPAADVYALGLVLLELLTGRRMYVGTPIEAAVARISQPPEVPAHLSAGWQSLLHAMTAMEPTDRPGAEEVARRLQAVADAYADSATTTRTFMPVPLPVPAAPTAARDDRPEPRTGVAVLARARRVVAKRPAAAVLVSAAAVLALVLGLNLPAGLQGEVEATAAATAGAAAGGAGSTFPSSSLAVVVGWGKQLEALADKRQQQRQRRARAQARAEKAAAAEAAAQKAAAERAAATQKASTRAPAPAPKKNEKPARTGGPAKSGPPPWAGTPGGRGGDPGGGPGTGNG